MNSKNIKIAIAGHTNTGKTTFIRTLMLSSVGEVGDSANVTKVGEPFYYDGLQATFIDTPGFQHGGLVSMYLESKQDDPNFSLPATWEKKIKYDIEAINALEQSHVVVYVANLCVVPDDSYEEEISLIRKIQPRVLAVLNQRSALMSQKQGSKAEIERDVESHINLWTSVCIRQGVTSVFVFDAHWDNRERINEIYDGIYALLTPDQRHQFREGLRKFKDRQLEIRHKACVYLSEYVKACQKLSTSIIKSKYTEEEANKAINEQLKKPHGEFFEKVTTLYYIASEYPNESLSQLSTRLDTTVDVGGRALTGVFGAAFAGIPGAAVGAGVGAALAGLFTGGLGAAAGAWLGAQIGGAAGALFGGVGMAMMDDSDTVEIRLTSDEVRNCAAAGLANVWGLMNVGFGRGRPLSQAEITTVRERVNSADILPRNTDWTYIGKDECVRRFEKALDRLGT
jgi:GTP-binding protein EngB required for normal cell division